MPRKTQTQKKRKLDMGSRSREKKATVKNLEKDPSTTQGEMGNLIRIQKEGGAYPPSHHHVR